MKKLLLLIVAISFVLLPVSAQYQDIFGSVDFYHSKVLDQNNHLDSWHKDENGPFEYIISLNAQWWRNAPFVNGWPIWCTAAEVTPEYQQSTGAIPGSACYFAIMACLNYYWYTGDTTFLSLAKKTGGYIIEHDLTSSTFRKYPGFPYAVGLTGDINPLGFGHPGDNSTINPKYGIMPDKGAMLGVSLLKLYKVTGETKYLRTAINIANCLSDNAVAGTSTNSPWPFRVMADNGSTFDGVFSANVSFACRLFDELLRIGQQGNGKYKKTRDAVWKWLKDQVIAKDDGSKWMNFFEDHSGSEPNSTQMNALETVRYLLEYKDIADIDWLSLAGKIISQVRRRWAITDYNRDGYLSIGEQDQDRTPYPSHTARWGSLLAMYAEAGGAAAYRDTAYHSMCYSAYSVEDNGFTSTFFNYNTRAWTTDSFGDFLYHFVVAMAAAPEWAGSGNHLLKSTGIIKKVTYTGESISWSTFDNSGTDKLKLVKEPVAVKVNGSPVTSFTWDATSKVLVIQRPAGTEVTVDLNHSISLDPVSLILSPGGNPGIITASLLPEGQSNQTVVWTSSNPGVATINTEGIVTPISVGTTVITASTSDGFHTATCAVSVMNSPPPTKPDLSSPYDSSVIYAPDTPLIWDLNGDAESYELQISLDPYFSSLLLDQQNLTFTRFSLSNLDNTTTYYWRVRSLNQNGISDWSDVWNFRIDLITQADTGIKEFTDKLKQNYPNPFSGHTTLEFEVGQPGHLEIAVLNSLGQTVNILKNGWIEQGSYRFDWYPPAGLARGFYYCRFKLNSNQKVIRMVYSGR